MKSPPPRLALACGHRNHTVLTLRGGRMVNKTAP